MVTYISRLRSDVPKECRVCDQMCQYLVEDNKDNNNNSTDTDSSHQSLCDPNYCITANVISAALFLIPGILLVVRLIQFHYNKKYPFWTLKKLVYLFGALACAAKVLR